MEHGIITPLIVRPYPDRKGFFELIAGECRWRNVGELLAAKTPGRQTLKELAKLPCVIREDLTDKEVEKLQFIENAQRNNLTKSEEVAWVSRQLAKREEGEKAAYTVESLAQSINKGVAWVRDCLMLESLPAEAMEAVDAKRLDISAAREIALVRDETARKEFMDLVLRGAGVNYVTPDGSALSGSMASNLRLARFCAALRDVPFDLEEEGVAGQVACVRCPHYMPAEQARQSPMCGNPGCLKEKKDERWMSMRRSAESSPYGIKVLEGDIAKEKLRDPDFVDLDADIPASDLSSHYDGRKVKTWRGVIDMEKVPVYLVRDPGNLRASWRASRKLIIAAQNLKALERATESPLVEAQVQPDQETKDFREEERRREEEKKKANKVLMKSLELISDRLLQQGVSLDAGPVVMEAMVRQMPPAAVAFLCRMWSLKPDTGKESRTLADHIKERATTKPVLEAYTAILAIAPYAVAHGLKDAGLRELCETQDMQLEQIEREARALVK